MPLHPYRVLSKKVIQFHWTQRFDQILGGSIKYSKQIILKNNIPCTLRNANSDDAAPVLDCFNTVRAQTDFLLTYPDEMNLSLADESFFLAKKEKSENEVFVIAEVEGKVVGTAGLDAVGNVHKIKHRIAMGVSVLEEYWGLGIGQSLTEALIECAKKIGYTQLELEVISENHAAISLYKKLGFVEYGRNPKGINSRFSGYQELVYMAKDLE